MFGENYMYWNRKVISSVNWFWWVGAERKICLGISKAVVWKIGIWMSFLIIRKLSVL